MAAAAPKCAAGKNGGATDVGVTATKIKPGDVGNVTVPVSLGTVGAASVVFISSSAQGIYERFRENAAL